LSAVRRRDQAAVKAEAQAIAQASRRREAEGDAHAFARRWRPRAPPGGTRLLRELPELLAFFQCPPPPWRRPRTSTVSERCFVEVRRHSRPMVCFVNVQSVERSIFCNRDPISLGVEAAHPSAIYTSSLTSPRRDLIWIIPGSLSIRYSLCLTSEV